MPRKGFRSKRRRCKGGREEESCLEKGGNPVTYGGHHFSQVAHKRSSSVKSGTISFSATTYSYRDDSTSRMSSGTTEQRIDIDKPGKRSGERVMSKIGEGSFDRDSNRESVMVMELSTASAYV